MNLATIKVRKYEGSIITDLPSGDVEVCRTWELWNSIMKAHYIANGRQAMLFQFENADGIYVLRAGLSNEDLHIRPPKKSKKSKTRTEVVHYASVGLRDS